ncbi:MAG TPA: hypothetical protein VNO54_06595 [Streptosporangiaceae bacterium]|nr:hypothetical protein [Streptosporangiaceae bacterium]
MASTGTQGTVAGRPQPQTTAEPAGGPFIRHAPDGRRAMYVAAGTAGGTNIAQFVANPMVSSPGWNKGYRVLTSVAPGTGGSATTVLAVPDAPYNFHQLVQLKDAFGTQLLTGPGFPISYLVPYYSGQFGTDEIRNPACSPQFQPVMIAAAQTSAGGFTWPTYFPFEFAKGYGVISGANAALLPVLQMNLAPASSYLTYTFTSGATNPTSTITVDADFYWLPNVPADPPGIGTTCQWIYQPCNPPIGSSFSGLVQLPRLGGYLTGLILELRNSAGNRTSEGVTAGGPGFVAATSAMDAGTGNPVGWPTRPKVVIDGVPLIDSLIGTIVEDMAISAQVGAFGGSTQSSATAAATTNSNPLYNAVGAGTGANNGSVQAVRPLGTLWFSRKTSLAQRDFGLLDTGEIFLSTNPGTQVEVAGYPWGSFASAPGQLNAVVGQIVPSGALVRGLPEA